MTAIARWCLFCAQLRPPRQVMAVGLVDGDPVCGSCQATLEMLLSDKGFEAAPHAPDEVQPAAQPQTKQGADRMQTVTLPDGEKVHMSTGAVMGPEMIEPDPKKQVTPAPKVKMDVFLSRDSEVDLEAEDISKRRFIEFTREIPIEEAKALFPQPGKEKMERVLPKHKQGMPITDELKRMILSENPTTMSITDTAIKYGVSQNSVSKIRREEEERKSAAAQVSKTNLTPTASQETVVTNLPPAPVGAIGRSVDVTAKDGYFESRKLLDTPLADCATIPLSVTNETAEMIFRRLPLDLKAQALAHVLVEAIS